MSLISFFSVLGESIPDNRPALSNTDMVLVFDGNSLTDGFNNAGISQYWPKEIQTWMTPKVNSLTFASYGLSGQALKEMISGASAKIDPNVDVLKTNVLIVNEDANGILVDSVSGADNYTDMNTYVTARYSAGWDYVIVWNGYYPRTPYDLYTPSQAQLDAQHDYFTLINATPLGDVNVDMRLNESIGGFTRAVAQDPVYFNDYLHLNATGYDQAAAEIQNRGILNIFQL